MCKRDQQSPWGQFFQVVDADEVLALFATPPHKAFTPKANLIVQRFEREEFRMSFTKIARRDNTILADLAYILDKSARL